MLHTLFDAQYIYLNTRWMTQNKAVITSVVFNHALRLRVLHKPEDVKTNGAPSSQNKSGKKSSNLLGQLNNLVTADLANISGARDVMSPLIQVPVKVFLSSWFFYAILGNATWVGLAVMLIMLPVPTWTSGLVNGVGVDFFSKRYTGRLTFPQVQKKKMQASDARIQGIKEALNVIRMLKQFGWESEVMLPLLRGASANVYVADQTAYLKAARGGAQMDLLAENICRRKYLDQVSNGYYEGCIVLRCRSYTVPQIHMIATFAFYTVVMRRPLSPSIIFSALAAMIMIRDAFIDNIYRLPQLIQARVSMGRVQDFLNDVGLISSVERQALDNYD
jgi:ABC-type multidrug transport system fused ATPase/permease subunit